MSGAENLINAVDAVIADNHFEYLWPLADYEQTRIVIGRNEYGDSIEKLVPDSSDTLSCVESLRAIHVRAIDDSNVPWLFSDVLFKDRAGEIRSTRLYRGFDRKLLVLKLVGIDSVEAAGPHEQKFLAAGESPREEFLRGLGIIVKYAKPNTSRLTPKPRFSVSKKYELIAASISERAGKLLLS